MKEQDIRPLELFNRYLNEVRKDVARLFESKRDFQDVACPACESFKKDVAFEKIGFVYQSCQDCTSLFVSPRPAKHMLRKYYEEGDSVKFWSSDFYKETAASRRDRIYRPRALLIGNMVKTEFNGKASAFADIGSGYGIFLEEISKLSIFEHLVGIEPAPNMASVCRERGFEVIEKSAEDLQEGDALVDVASCFEVLEHVYSPKEFLQGIRSILKKNGILVFSTLTISGFDLQTLWQHSKSIYPPHHINLISVEGMQQLVERCGFETIDLSTPGKLDLDIVRNALKEDPSIPVPRFVEYLVHKRGDGTHGDFQSFLERNNLSSHVRCIVRKLGS